MKNARIINLLATMKALKKKTRKAPNKQHATFDHHTNNDEDTILDSSALKKM